MGWSSKYKKSIDCNNPKGFSQKAHCAGKKKTNERVMKLSEFKEAITKVLRERSINAIAKLQQKNVENIAKALEFYKKNKHTDKKEPFIKLLKKLGKEKESLAKELDLKVSGMYKNAEYKGENVVMNHDGKSAPYGSGYEKVNEASFRPNSGTKSGGTHGLDSRKYELKRDVKGVKIGDYTNITLPKGTIIYNIPGGVFAHHRSLRSYESGMNKYFNKPTFRGISVRREKNTILSIEKNSKILESVNEGASSEEKRIAMLAVKKQAKYRNVSLSQAIQDQINALEELKRQYKGK